MPCFSKARTNTVHTEITELLSLLDLFEKVILAFNLSSTARNQILGGKLIEILAIQTLRGDGDKVPAGTGAC